MKPYQMQQFCLIFSLFLASSIISFGQKPATTTEAPATPDDELLLEMPASIPPEDFAKIHTIEDTLGVLGYAIVNDSLAENRFASCRKFIPTLVNALKFENSFDYKFERLNTISIQYAPDNSFRIFTWQLYVDVDEYKYYGAIQMNTPELKLFPLVDRSEDIMIPEFEVTDNKNWYGSLYYNIRAFDTAEGTKYLLLGYDGYQFFTKRKVLDVLHFQDGKPAFGAPVFVRGEDSKSHPQEKLRVIYEYYAGATVKMNYDEVHEVVLFDHLEEMNTAKGPQMIPDGTYEAYQLQEGNWVHVEKMFHFKLKDGEAPREQPVFSDEVKRKERKDIFGKSRN